MNDGLVTVAVALCCVLAIGMSSTALDASVATSPDDVIDLDYSGLPVGAGQLTELSRAVNGQSSPDAAPRNDPTAESPPSQNDAPRQGHGDSLLGSSTSSQQQDRSTGTGTKIVPPSLLDRLLALLRELLGLLPWLFAVALLAGAVRYRDRLAALAPQVRPPTEEGTAADDGDEALPTPSNPVGRAWVRTVRRFGVDDRPELTPRERARIAVERGAPAEPVGTLTSLSEEVQYGGRPVTPERRQRAEQSDAAATPEEDQ